MRLERLISNEEIAISDSAPSSPTAGDLWYESDSGSTYIYYDSSWIEIGVSSPLADGSVTAAKLASNSVSTATIQNSSVIESKIADSSVTTNKIANASITTDKLETTAQPGLVLVTKQTVGSGVSSVTINNCFSSTYDNYRIVFSNIATSTNNDLYLRMALNGTESNTGYYRGFSYVSLSTGAVTGVGSANTDSHIISSVTNTSFRHTGVIDVLQPNLAQYTGIISSSYIMRTDIASSGVTGSHQISTSYNGFVILTSSGTITGGTIRVYGYKN